MYHIQGLDGHDRRVSLQKDGSGKLGLRVKALGTGSLFKQFFPLSISLTKVLLSRWLRKARRRPMEV